MAVVVQQMVFQVSGILFTADPVTGNRNRSVEAAWLGECYSHCDARHEVRDLPARRGRHQTAAINARRKGGTRHQRQPAPMDA